MKCARCKIPCGAITVAVLERREYRPPAAAVRPVSESNRGALCELCGKEAHDMLDRFYSSLEFPPPMTGGGGWGKEQGDGAPG